MGMKETVHENFFTQLKSDFIKLLQCYIQSRQEITYLHFFFFNAGLLEEKIRLAQALLAYIETASSETIIEEAVDVINSRNIRAEIKLGRLPVFFGGGQLGRDLLIMKEYLEKLKTDDVVKSVKNIQEKEIDQDPLDISSSSIASNLIFANNNYSRVCSSHKR